ncbi:MAG: Mth938-like domain-containing protein [Pseudomonadota bacterium]
MIESYSFGKIIINGHPYTRDIIIMADGKIISPWWRKTSHVLAVSDIEEIVKSTPGVLVVGTGDPGMMKPVRGFTADLKAKNIRVVVLPTEHAVITFNKLKKESEFVAACFHLTC